MIDVFKCQALRASGKTIMFYILEKDQPELGADGFSGKYISIEKVAFPFTKKTRKFFEDNYELVWSDTDSPIDLKIPRFKQKCPLV